MAINRTLWEKTDINNMFCPICQKLLEYKDLETILHKNKDSQEDTSLHDKYIFSGELSCSCSQHFLVHGNKETHDGGKDIYDIKGVYPVLNIFSLPDSCPQNIRLEIIKSFELYWINLDACANAIRKTIELFLDVQKVPKKTKKTETKQSRYLSLYKRIDLYKKHDLKPFLHANRVIGNKGSHSQTCKVALSNKDILDAYEFVEHIITIVYDKSLREKASKHLNTKSKKTTC